MTIDEMIEVLQAAKAGKKIQRKHKLHDREWAPLLAEDAFDFITYDYRVETEPRRFWILEIGGLVHRVFKHPGDCSETARDELIEVVEVMK